MKSASAMKYGGELVDAVDCDYNSFKELIPLCPNCKEPVFLRTGGQRESVKGKAYQIGPHWCHFKGISAEQVSGCELRVNGYTEKDRAKIAAQARGQRLKLLQRWFARILRDNPFLDHCFVCEQNQTQHWGKIAWDNYVDCVRALFIASKEQIKKDVLNLTSDNYRSRLRWLNHDRSQWSDRTKNYVEKVLSSELEFNQSMKILGEVIDFLASRTGLAFFSALCADGIASNVAFRGESANAADPRTVVDNMVAQLVLIPWASEFQRLEAEANQRKGAA